jgi:hypothetical protein
VQLIGIDISRVAIEEAERRSMRLGLAARASCRSPSFDDTGLWPGARGFPPVEESVDHGALSDAAPDTSRSHVAEGAHDRTQVGGLAPYLLQVIQGELANLRAGVVPAVDESKERSDLLQGEAEFSRTSNERRT